MKTHAQAPAEQTQQQSTQASAPLFAQPQATFEDARPEATQLRTLQLMMAASPQQQKLQALQAKMVARPLVQRMEEEEPLQGKFETTQLMEEEEPLQGKFSEAATMQLAEKPNNTGLPNQLKAGIESLSGMSMNHVKVHYNSDKPAQLNAHAYAQGSDVHVAAGQEQHLPHEAWHVVQQAQGRVKPTVQMKGGVPVNDDVGLETEADVMGAKALGLGAVQRYTEGNAEKSELTPSFEKVEPKHESREIKTPAKAFDHRSTLQTKRRYLNGGENHMDKAWSLVQAFEESQEIPVEKRLSHTEFVYGITGLTVSEIDYGVIDLGSPQQVGLLYYDIRKQAENLSGMEEKDLRTEEDLKKDTRKEDIKERDKKEGKIDNQERTAKERRLQKDKEDQAYLEKSPNPEMTVDLAILGAGAATAYYLTSMGEQINRDKTIVIGTVQPWAGLRGPGVVNHPEHMISALRDEVGLKDEQLMDRQAFSDNLEMVISKRVRHRLVEQVLEVDKITHNEMPFYKIKLDGDKIFYAKKVVAGLGIGPHMDRVQQPVEGETRVTEENQNRIMDMDTFQRGAARISGLTKNPQDVTVFVAGGNAAIDVVKTCIDIGFRIIWYPGGNAPGFLQGTDNEVVQEEYEKLARAEGSKIAKYVQDRAGPVVKGSTKPLLISGNEADYFVFGQSPDVSKVKNIFHKEHILDHLETMKDKSHYFRGEGDGAALGLQIPVEEGDPTALEIIGGSAFRMASGGQGAEFEGVIDSLPLNVVGNDQLAPIRAQVEASQSFVPSYVEDDVNMAVDNITVIAIHIAVKYPNLTEEQANMWADRIIRWRRPSAEDIEKYKMLQGPIPNPHAKPRENAESFSKWFKKRLSEENEKAK